MKKSLLALVALGAFAGVAQAQSSVTVYGTLDAGFRRDDSGSNLNGVTTGLVSNTLTSDRLGFRGTEDLGGGQRAFFPIGDRHGAFYIQQWSRRCGIWIRNR